MRSFPITGTLEPAYRGCGYAIGAINHRELVDFLYLADLDPNFHEDRIEETLLSARLAPTLRYMIGRGELVVGMCSAGSFTII